MKRGIQMADIQQEAITPISPKNTDNLSAILSGELYTVLLETLCKDGIFTIQQYRQKFRRHSLIRYLNAHDLYNWRERVKVVKAVSSILGELGAESNQSTVNPPDSSVSSQDRRMIVDFDSDANYQYTYPTKVILGGIVHIVNNWTDFLVQLCEYLIANHPAEMHSLISSPLFPGTSRSYLRPDKVHGLASKKLSNDSWIITNYNATILVQIAKAICLHCNHPLTDILVYYEQTQKRRSERISRKILEKPIRVYKSPNVQLEISQKQLESYIKLHGLSACSIDEIIAGIRLPLRTRRAIMRAIEENEQIVEIKEGHFIHKNVIVDIDEAAETLLRILQTQFIQFDGYSNYRLLFDAARINLSLFMNDNAFEDDVTIYYLTKHLFSKERFGGHRFAFYGNEHIWEKEPDYPKSIKGLLIHQARLAGGKITRSECEIYLDKINMGRSNFNQAVLRTGDSTFYQYEAGTYLLSEMMNIDTEWHSRLKKALDSLFVKNAFIIPRDINEIWYESLPELPIGLRWTPLLLQEALNFNNSLGYKAIFAPLLQNKDTVAAVIVPIDSKLVTFADVVNAYLRNTIELPERMEAEELRLILRNAGMIDGNELVYNMHKALNDHRFAWSNENRTVFILRE